MYTQGCFIVGSLWIPASAGMTTVGCSYFHPSQRVRPFCSPSSRGQRPSPLSQTPVARDNVFHRRISHDLQHRGPGVAELPERGAEASEVAGALPHGILPPVCASGVGKMHDAEPRAHLPQTCSRVLAYKVSVGDVVANSHQRTVDPVGEGDE